LLSAALTGSFLVERPDVVIATAIVGGFVWLVAVS
jgi:hypothetical protein